MPQHAARSGPPAAARFLDLGKVLDYDVSADAANREANQRSVRRSRLAARPYAAGNRGYGTRCSGLAERPPNKKGPIILQGVAEVAV
jgi:hypothetical protein